MVSRIPPGSLRSTSPFGTPLPQHKRSYDLAARVLAGGDERPVEDAALKTQLESTASRTEIGRISTRLVAGTVHELADGRLFFRGLNRELKDGWYATGTRAEAQPALKTASNVDGLAPGLRPVPCP